jgi:hypothetical protein
MFEHIPKINAGLGCLALLCFFLPWISFSCGTVTFLNISGFHLAAGKMPVDETVIRQYEQRGGSVTGDERIPSDVRGARPRYVYLIVPLCALNIIGFSLRMMGGGMDRFKAVAVMAFADIGCVFLVGAGLMDFGFEIPPASSMLIQSSLEPGYFGAVAAFLAAGVLPLLTLRAIGGSSVAQAPVEEQIPEQAAADAVTGTEEVSEDMTEYFGLTAKKQPEVRPPAPPGAKTCPGCGVVVGTYQVKCVKCGSALTPAK